MTTSTLSDTKSEVAAEYIGPVAIIYHSKTGTIFTLDDTQPRQQLGLTCNGVGLTCDGQAT
jgi:hypothetical protein